MAHFEAEYGDFYELLRQSPGKLVNAIRVLAQRKTFKGTCPVCEEWQ